MNINGHYIEKGEADKIVQSIKNAVEKISHDDPLRPYFDFLLGYIAEASDFKEDNELDEKLVEEAVENRRNDAYGELLSIKL
jgi:hypothetical protein